MGEAHAVRSSCPHGFSSTPTLAQTPVDTATNSNDSPPPPIVLKHHGEVPDAPPAKSLTSACPGGNGKPCAVPGGHYSDSFALS